MHLIMAASLAFVSVLQFQLTVLVFVNTHISSLQKAKIVLSFFFSRHSEIQSKRIAILTKLFLMHRTNFTHAKETLYWAQDCGHLHWVNVRAQKWVEWPSAYPFYYNKQWLSPVIHFVERQLASNTSHSSNQKILNSEGPSKKDNVASRLFLECRVLKLWKMSYKHSCVLKHTYTIISKRK